MKKILVTCALPYANGPIHIGHMLEQIQADIWVRYNKLLGNVVYFICADDSHGTAILLKSRELNISCENIINIMYKKHKRDFKAFNISHDLYFTTHNELNYFFSLYILKKFQEKKLIIKKKIYQLYDKKANIFLPDRFVQGECPRCNTKKQYGDNCSFCGNVYYAYQLKNPVSLVTKTIPVKYYTKHLFLSIKFLKNILYKWIKNSLMHRGIKKQLFLWLNDNLNDWNITRDKPYFGFKIPSKYIRDKYFYVWMDATICYISSFKYLCKLRKYNFNDFWSKNSKYDLYHFIGKDILYFHGLYWPSLLYISNFRLPTSLVVHGHVKINNYKMSKSANNFISAKKWLQYFDSDSLRYYYASKLSFKSNDVNFNLSEFLNKVNNDLINKFINIPFRVNKYLEKYFNNYLSENLYNVSFYNFFVKKSTLVSKYFLKFNYSKSLHLINKLLDMVNCFINNEKPWLMFLNGKMIYLHQICTTIINIFRVIAIYLSPVIPELFIKIEKYFNINLTWDSIQKPLIKHKMLNCNIIFLKRKEVPSGFL